MIDLLALGAAALLAPTAAMAPAGPGAHAAAEHRVAAAFPQPVAVTGASMVMRFDDALVMIDPVGPRSGYLAFGHPDIVVLTRADPSHLSVETMIGLLRRDTVVLAPQAVIDALPPMISNNVIRPFEAGTSQTVRGIAFTAQAPGTPLPPGTRVYDRARGEIGVLVTAAGTTAAF